MNLFLMLLASVYGALSLIAFVLGAASTENPSRDLIMPITIIFPAFWFGRVFSGCAQVIGAAVMYLSDSDLLSKIGEFLVWTPFKKGK